MRNSITNVKELDAWVARMKETMAGVTPKLLRESQSVRNMVLSSMTEIGQQITAYPTTENLPVRRITWEDDEVPPAASAAA